MEEGTVNLSTALMLFKDNLDDIREAIIDNMLFRLEQLPKPAPTGNTMFDSVREEVHLLQTKESTDTLSHTLKRIISMQAPKRVGSITDADIERAKEHPIADLYDGKIVRGMCKCPFHADSTASLSFRRNNRFRCFGCDERGSVIDFYMKTRGVTFIEAVKALI